MLGQKFWAFPSCLYLVPPPGWVFPSHCSQVVHVIPPAQYSTAKAFDSTSGSLGQNPSALAGLFILAQFSSPASAVLKTKIHYSMFHMEALLFDRGNWLSSSYRVRSWYWSYNLSARVSLFLNTICMQRTSHLSTDLTKAPSTHLLIVCGWLLYQQTTQRTHCHLHLHDIFYLENNLRK